MKKRRILSVLLLSTIVGVSLAGCQSQDNPNPNPNPGPNNPVEDTFEITLIGNTTRTLEIGKTDLVKFEMKISFMKFKARQFLLTKTLKQ